jgi:hypothetical protein
MYVVRASASCIDLYVKFLAHSLFCVGSIGRRYRRQDEIGTPVSLLEIFSCVCKISLLIYFIFASTFFIDFPSTFIDLFVFCVNLFIIST